jgi:VCBS repeat-containing protein
MTFAKKAIRKARSNVVRLARRRALAGERLEDRAMLAVLFSHGGTDPIHAIAPTQAAFDDLGFDWFAAGEGFDDSTWQTTSGAANGVGYDVGATYDPLLGADLETQMHGAASTLFARAEFSVADPAAVDLLTLSMRYDDGFIAWLNGTEVARANVSGTYPGWSATADAPHQASTTTFEEFDLTADRADLHAGVNVLAIRLLNASAADDDALLQFELKGESRTGPPLARDDAAEALEGQPLVVQVLANDDEGSDPIAPGSVQVATNPTHGMATANPDGTITYTPSALYNGADSFTYTVGDTASVGQPTMQTLVATNGPVRVLVPSSGSLGTTWRGGDANFNDASWTSGTLGVGYDTNTGGVDFRPYFSTNVQSMQNVNTSVYMRSAFTIDNPADVAALTLRMRYDDGFVAFINGVQIAAGNAPESLAYNSRSGEIDRSDNTALNVETFNAAAALSALRPGANTLAIQGLNANLESSDLLMQPELIATIRPSGHRSNPATVTVNVTGVDYAPIAHDDSYHVDEGATLDTATIAGGSTTTENIIPAGAEWKYSDTGTLPANDAQGDTWKQAAFDDAAWSSGAAQLGYGDGDETTHVRCGPTDPTCASDNFITTWFRKHFNIAPGQAALVQSLAVELMRDDGAAVYVNGVEVQRSNLPGVVGDGAITATTGAMQATTFDESNFQPPVNVDLTVGALRTLLHDGDNVVAVEVHQEVSTSSDISFDLKLAATVAPAAGVLGNDTEPDGQSMTAALESGVQHGALDLRADGTFVYTPETGYIGSDSFTYRASDGVNLSSPATVTIVVDHVPPLAQAESYSTDEDVPLVVDRAHGVLANDSDKQGHALTAVLRTAPVHGTLALAADGAFQYTPTANYHGPDSFVYRATDGTLNSADVTVSLSIASVIDAPTANAESYAALENQTLTVDGRVGPGTTAADFLGLQEVGTVNVSASVSQIQYSPRYEMLFLRESGNRIRVIDARTGLQIGERLPTETFTDMDLSPDGEYLFVPDYGGTNIGYGSPLRPSYVHRFRLATQTWEVKKAPAIAYRLEAVDADRFLMVDQDQSVNITLNSFGGPAQLITQLKRSGGYQGDLYYDPTFSRTLYSDSGISTVGIRTFTIVGNDFVGGTSRSESSSQGIMGSSDGRYFFFGGAQFPATNLQTVVHTYPNSVRAAPGGLVFTSQGAIFGADNGAMLASLPYATSVYDDSRDDLNFWAYQSSNNVLHHYRLPYYGRGALANDVSPENQLLTAEVVTPPAHGTLQFDAVGTFRYKPNANFVGSDSFTYAAHSADGVSTPATVTITVAHNGPAAANDTYNIAEDAALHVAASEGLLANDSDSQGHLMAALLAAAPTHGTLQFSVTGAFVYTPVADFAGIDTFTYYATDGVLQSPATTVTIAVTNVNDAPIASNDVFSTGVGQTLSTASDPGLPTTVTAITRGATWKYFDRITPGAYPVDAQSRRWVETNFDDASWSSGAALLGYGAIDAAPVATELDIAAIQRVTALFRKQFVVDHGGRAQSLRFEDLFDDGAAVYINGREVLRVNLPGAVGSPLGASDFALAAGDEASYAAQTVDLAPFADLLVDGTNTIAVELHQINLSTTDAGFDLGLQVVVGPDPRAKGVLGNDTDADIDDPLSATLVTGPFHGAIGFRVDGTFDYAPEPGFSGVDQFTYRVRDAAGASDLALAMINVGDSNEPPIATPDHYITWRGAPINLDAASGPLANDFDANGDALSAGIARMPEHGALSLSSNGAFVYTPASGFVGVDSFDYRAGDGSSNAIATVTIDVLLLRDPIDAIPTAADDVFQLASNSVVSYFSPGVIANDLDPEGRELSAFVAQSPWHGELHLATDGSFTYQPRAGFYGVDQFTYRVTDGNTFSSPAMVSIFVPQIAVPQPAAETGTIASGAGESGAGGSSDSGSLPRSGDLNGDGRLTRADLTILLQSFGSEIATVDGGDSTSFAAAADLNRDRRVDIRDAVQLRDRLEAVAPPAASAIVGSVPAERTRPLRSAPAAPVRRALSRPRAEAVDHAMEELTSSGSRLTVARRRASDR